MNNPLPTMQEAAQEAEFQLLAAKDLLEWQCALASAIHLDHLHNCGKSAGALAELAKYFSDTGFGGVYSAIDQFKQLGESEPAPQNAQYENVARIPEGPDTTLAERLLLARESTPLSQADLARLIGAQQTSISQIESGKTKRTSYLAEIARACKVDINWLAFGSGGAQ
ncbi:MULTISPECIES: helix-turn-helix transcriptional regulator [unclassified Pseudomonas]|uniref:helix-turn-helix domain-containing protein n=1 Tax=unclassified Pseudomonas TaxID=196821 RepID=UPI000A1F1B3E|nr:MULTISPECIES: helix-turn-helix domain-containing protein [unclassified Pseudomonas]